MKNIKKDLNLSLNNCSGYFDLKPEDLFEIAVRKNTKRNFLFVSKLIGKHIPIKPQALNYTGALLANKFFKEVYNKTLYSDNDCQEMVNYLKGSNTIKEFTTNINPNEKILIIGFAETATGLGFSFFKNFKSTTYYVHTTRETIDNVDLLFGFEEEHSHATKHKCYFKNPLALKDIDRIILIDDEFTTGNTCLNLIAELNKLYPNKHYSLISILDWRNKESKLKFKQFSEQRHIPINVISLFNGEIEYQHETRSFQDLTVKKTFDDSNYYTIKINKNQLTFNGSVEVDWHVFDTISSLSDIVIDKIKFLNFKKPLVMGFEENIYLPSAIAKKLNTKFASLTLSPIYPNVDYEEKYPIKNAFQFKNYYKNLFIYNMSDEYEDILIVADKKIEESAKRNIAGYLHSIGIKNVCFCIIREDDDFE